MAKKPVWGFLDTCGMNDVGFRPVVRDSPDIRTIEAFNRKTGQSLFLLRMSLRQWEALREASKQLEAANVP